MDKIEYVWLEEVRKNNTKFNYNMLKKILKFLNISLKGLYCQLFNVEMLKQNIKIDISIIQDILNNDIKEKSIMLYKKIKENGLKIVTIEDKEYPKKILDRILDIPFCILVDNELSINLNNKNVYFFYDSYYSKSAIRIINYFAKIVKVENGNIFSEYNFQDKMNINIIDFDSYICNVKESAKYIVLYNKNDVAQFKANIIDILIIIEARYELGIVSLVDSYLELGKDIYVVPSNIFRANGYFSNYLIKQGAQILLNKWDLKYILANIIG